MLDIDTWLMSCRVIGRTVETMMLEHLCRRAAQLGCTSLQATYIPTEKNAMAADAYAKCGFERVGQNGGQEIWFYDLFVKGMANPSCSGFLGRWLPSDSSPGRRKES